LSEAAPHLGLCEHPSRRGDQGSAAYHSRYTLKNGQTALVIRRKQHNGTFCDRYGMVFYDLKTPEDKVERAVHQSIEGLCPQAVTSIEGVHSATVQRWVERARDQARSALKKAITKVSAENVELNELYSFAAPSVSMKRNFDSPSRALKIQRLIRIDRKFIYLGTPSFYH
jgi:uncharacterized protein with von Willebrand factor type A (vWA) domain